MRDKELKQLLQQAYTLTPSKQEYSFLRRYQKRRISMTQILRIELKYMGLRSLLAGLIVWAMLAGLILTGGGAKAKWIIASILPVLSLLLTAMGGRSERYGMEELEASSRFSLRMLRMTRMCLLGICSLVITLGTTGMFRAYVETGFLRSFCLVSIPYLLNVWGCLWLIRRWHAKENIYGCIGLTMITCLLPSLVQSLQAMESMSDGFIYTALVALTAAACREAWVYAAMSPADVADSGF